MRTRRRVVAALAVVLAGAVTAVRVALPERFASGVRLAREATGVGPRPVVLGAVVLVVVVLWLVGMWLAGRFLFRMLRWVWPRYKRVTGLVLPDSPLVQFAAGVMLLLAGIILLVGALPSLVGDVGTSTANVTGVAEDLSEQGFDGQRLTSEWGQAIEGDTAGTTTATVRRNDSVEGPDTDGDGLPDRWERAGETPDGARLPDADPRHKDLYVQVNYGEGIEPLTDTERRQLREAWAEMPVGNPDNETGIDVHVLENGSLGEDAVFERATAYDRYYTESRLGPRYGVYRQVVYGRLELGSTVGRATTPGYASIVEGRRAEDYDTTYTPRVGVTTHELLHNVAGQVDGRSHTGEGWLASGSTDEYLSPATARELNESGLYGPVS